MARTKWHNFQYPPSDRAHCNFGAQEEVEATLINFQYPPSDRAHCNSPQATDQALIVEDFQYPPSDRAHCNYHGCGIAAQGVELSVSSIGSSPL